MRRVGFFGTLTFVVYFAGLAAPARAGLLFESAQTAVTGPTSNYSAIENDTSFFSGVNFFLASPAQVSDIGGHFINTLLNGNNEIFGAIVRVNGPTDPPSPVDLSGPDVLGTTLITLPPVNDSENESGPLSLALTPGWYAVIFGSGKFGATNDASAAIVTSNGAAANFNGVITYALRQADGLQFFQAAGARYFVEGQLAASAVPEPSSALLLLVGLGALAAVRGRSFRQRSEFQPAC
jgi:hypothetical protein